MKAGLLWDDSYLWAIMSIKALRSVGLDFDIIRANQLKRLLSETFGLLYVPGGWASNKLKSIGETGINTIREFVHKGGVYFGTCGGAGLATSDGIGLIDIKRLPTSKRVPSLSGRVRIDTAGHPLFESISSKIFYVWWPSQFVCQSPDVKVIATYKEVLDDCFSSDLPVGAVRRHANWSDLETLYGINLDPSKLIGEPLLLEGAYGDGKVILSLIHFDSPEDTEGHRVLKNLWHYAGVKESCAEPCTESGVKEDLKVLTELQEATEGLIAFGIENFLWFWRNSMLLQWRRGIRGLECCNLYIMTKELCRLVSHHPEPERWLTALKVIRDDLLFFLEDLKRLLVLERLEMQRSRLTYLETDNPEIMHLRDRLFSRSKSYGGRYKALIDRIDDILYSLLLDPQTRHIQEPQF